MIQTLLESDITKVTGIRTKGVAVGLCRLLVSLASVGAIFGLELLVMSQVSEAAMLSAGDVIVFVALLWQHTSPLGFTLTFWCQFTVMFLLFLNSVKLNCTNSISHK
uniref:Uncharacterized protein n=1 Tax=Oncorhynchus tshawytscha TaxID=74940 RepID=A0A8C8CK94_ONCTS